MNVQVAFFAVRVQHNQLGLLPRIRDVFADDEPAAVLVVGDGAMNLALAGTRPV